MGKIILGIEHLRCPRCRRMNAVEIHSDLPARDWMTCRWCGYKAIVNYEPILDKYCTSTKLSRAERRNTSAWLQKELKDRR
jgi:phage FluMu protein Com